MRRLRLPCLDHSLRVSYEVTKYKIQIETRQDSGRRNPNTVVSWICTRHSYGDVGRGRVHIYPPTAESAEAMAVDKAVKHAEANSETLVAADIEVELETNVQPHKGGRESGPPHQFKSKRMVAADIFAPYVKPSGTP